MEISNDIVIIGAGAVGCAVAGELAFRRCGPVVLEKEADVAAGTSGRNSAVVHAGFNNRPGSLMARLCVEGNRGFEELCRTLDVPYKKTGKLVVALDRSDLPGLEKLLSAGRDNGVEGLSLVAGEELSRLEPYVRGIAAMHSRETAIINPFLYTVALAEQAVENGARFFLNHEVVSISRIEEPSGMRFRIEAGGDVFLARFIVNSAGLFSARISAMAGDAGYAIYPCRGEYHILDTEVSRFLSMPVYPVPRPGEGGLGVHLTPTTDGNILIGPSAEYLDGPEDYATTAAVMKKLFAEARDLLPMLDESMIIRSYAGIRAKLTPPDRGGYADFVIRESEAVPGLVNLIGIESPGLTASVPIAGMVAEIIDSSFPLGKKSAPSGRRTGIPRLRELPWEEKEKLVAADPDWGETVCMCEQVSKAEILRALDNPLGVKTIAGVKYRTHALAGRCQGGFCLPRIVELLTEEGFEPGEISERGNGSRLFGGRGK